MVFKFCLRSSYYDSEMQLGIAMFLSLWLFYKRRIAFENFFLISLDAVCESKSTI